jgi:hypothetical protein
MNRQGCVSLIPPWIETDGVCVGGNGLVLSSESSQPVPQFLMQLDIPWFTLNRSLKALNRILILA